MSENFGTLRYIHVIVYIFRILVEKLNKRMSDLGQLKKDFSQLVLKVPQWTLTQFVLWLDLKVAEYKVNGYMVLGLYLLLHLF